MSKRIKVKTAVQLKLSSMSVNYSPSFVTQHSGKHRSQWMQKSKKKVRQSARKKLQKVEKI